MGSAVSSAGRGSPTPTIKLLRAFRHSQFHSYQSTGLTRERTKMTISCDIPTQMIVDDSSSSSSSPEQTNNLAEVMKARLDANLVLDHPWVLYGGNSNSLM